jgi:tetratricopeptide (TPR) repeat protein/CHAT domain-containing protein
MGQVTASALHGTATLNGTAVFLDHFKILGGTALTISRVSKIAFLLITVVLVHIVACQLVWTLPGDQGSYSDGSRSRMAIKSAQNTPPAPGKNTPSVHTSPLANVFLIAESAKLLNSGNEHLGLGLCEEAILYYEKCLEVGKRIGEPGLQRMPLAALGNAYLKSGQCPKAMETFARLEALAVESKAPKDRCAALIGSGDSCRCVRDFVKASNFYEQAVVTARNADDKNAECVALLSLGQVSLGMKKGRETTQLSQSALAIAQNLADKKLERDGLALLGRSLQNQRRFSEAEVHYNKALAICRDLKQPEEEARILVWIGGMLQSKGSLRQAPIYYDQAATLYTAERHFTELAATYTTLAELNLRLKKKDKAQDNRAKAEQAEEEARRTKDLLQEIDGFGKSALIASMVGRVDQTVPPLEQALILLQQLNSPKLEIHFMKKLATAYLDLKNQDKASDLLLQALGKSKQGSDSGLEMDCLDSLVEFFRKTGATDRSISYLLEALEVARANRNAEREVRYLAELGDIHLKSGRHVEAASCYLQALERARTGDAERVPRTVDRLADLWFSRGEFEKAVPYLEESLELSRTKGDSTTEAKRLGELSVGYIKMAKYDRAVHFALELLPFGERINNPQQTSVALFNVGLIYSKWADTDKSKFELAVDYMQRALQKKETTKDFLGTIEVLRNLGKIYERIGAADKSIESYAKALDISRQIKNAGKELQIEREMGDALNRAGRFEDAISHYRTALELTKITNHPVTLVAITKDLGTMYIALGRPDEALNVFSSCEKTLTDNQSLDNLVELLSAWGTGLSTVGRYDEAEATYARAIKILQSKPSHQWETELRVSRGMNYVFWGKYADAEKEYEQAVHCADQSANAILRILARVGRGSLFLQMGSYAKAVKDFSLARDLARSSKFLISEGACLLLLGKAHAENERFDSALEQFKEAKQLAMISGELSFAMIAFGATALSAEIYADRGDREQALILYSDAIELAENRLRSAYLASLGRNARGEIYRNDGRFELALTEYEEALRIGRQSSHPLLQTNVLNNLGLAFAEIGNLEEAERRLKEAIEIADRSGLLLASSKAGLNQGWTQLLVGQYGAAGELVTKAQPSWQEVKGSEKWPVILLAMSKLGLGEITEGESLARQAGSPIVLGLVHLKKGDYKEAQRQYKLLLRSAEARNNLQNLFIARTGLGTTYEKLAENTPDLVMKKQYLEKAATMFESAAGLTELMRLGVTRRSREPFYRVQFGGFQRTAPYKGCARVELVLGEATLALRWSDLSKARYFADIVSRKNDGVSGESVDSAERMLMTIQKARDKLGRARAKMDRSKNDDPQERRRLNLEEKQLQGEIESEIARLKEKHPFVAATSFPEPLDLAQSGLRPKEWALVYDVSDGIAVIAYLIHGHELMFSEKLETTPAELKSSTQDFVNKLKESPFKAAIEFGLSGDTTVLDAGRKLYDQLVRPVLAKAASRPFPGESLIVVPDGFLWTVPFEALVTSQGGRIKLKRWTGNGVKDRFITEDAEFFGEAHPLVYQQSLAAMTVERKRESKFSRSRQTLVVADPVLDSSDSRTATAGTQENCAEVLKALRGLQGAPGSENCPGPLKRAKAVGRIAETLEKLPKADIVTAVGFSATVDRIIQPKDQDLLNYRYVVFGTHGWAGEGCPDIPEPVLLLSPTSANPKGHLAAGQVVNLNLNADLVALTACLTGHGKLLSGEGMVTMGRAFQMAGARAVLTSLWEVDPDSAVTLLTDMLNHLVQPEEPRSSVLMALQAARAKLRKNGYDHPFFWSAFVVVGEDSVANQ